MRVDPVVLISRRVAMATLLFTMILLPLAAMPGSADDLPESAAKSFAKARAQFASGEKKLLKRAWTRMRKLRPTCRHSVDYWAFHLTLGKAMGKSEPDLWAAIEAAEKASPTCPSYEILRARLAPDAYEKQAHLEKAVALAPQDLMPRFLLVDLLLATEEEIDAEELLDEILVKHPNNVGALVRKGRVQLSGEYYKAAIDFADEVLAKHPLPEMHDLKAQTYLAQHASEGKDVLAKAHSAALAAVKLRPDPAFVVTLAEVLERRDKVPEARELIAKAFADAPSPLLAGLLGDYAFRTGDYAKAAKALQHSADTSALSAKGLAECHIRLGSPAKARAALGQLERLDLNASRAYLAYAYAGLGDTARAITLAKALDEEDRNWFTAFVHANEAEPTKMGALLEAAFTEATLQAEWVLLYYVEAHLMKAMGVNAVAGLKTRLAKGSHSAAAKKLARDKPPEKARDLKANTLALMGRIPIYETSVCGHRFSMVGEPRPHMSMDTEAESSLTFYYVCFGRANCPEDRQRSWRFNRKQIVQGEANTLLGEGDWSTVKAAWIEAAGHIKKQAWGSAVASLDKVIKGEPHWHRAVLLRAAVQALADPALRKSAGMSALTAMAAWPGDPTGRHLAILVASLGGLDVDGEIKAHVERMERYAIRRLGDL